MKLTEEEKKYFKAEDDEIFDYISAYVDEGLTQSLFHDDEEVQVTHAFLKKIVLKAAQKREIKFDPDETYDIDDVLKSIVKVRDEDYFTGFDTSLYKNKDNLKSFLDEKAKDLEYDKIDSMALYFGFMTDDFREFLVKKASYLKANIDRIYEEYADDERPPEPEDVFSTYQSQEGVEDSDIVEDAPDFDWSDWDSSDDVWGDDDFQKEEEEKEKEEPEPITDENIVDLIKYLNTYSEIVRCRENGVSISRYLRDLANDRKLESFLSDEEFAKDLRTILDHDTSKHKYYFHGTQSLSQAGSILVQNLGMTRDSVSTTAYPEFDERDIILYRKGFGGEVGRDAIVIIDQPIEDNKFKEIVEPKPEDMEIDFSPSGTQGLDNDANFYIDSKYILGYVDKVNRKVITNPRYYDYNNLMERMGRKIDNHLHEDDDAR